MNPAVKSPSSAPQTFSYAHPGEMKGKKKIVRLCESDIVRASVQVVTEGGENNLHNHPGVDGIWMVLKGRVKFYGENDEFIGEFGPHEGIHSPRGYKYWFESSDLSQHLEILQIHAYAQNAEGKRVNDKRIDQAPQKDLIPEHVEIVSITRMVG